jgi:hypothetical protein
MSLVQVIEGGGSVAIVIFWSLRLGLILSLFVSVSSTPAVLAQTVPFAIGGDNPEDENSIIPFKVKFRGVINSAVQSEKSLAVVTLQIPDYSGKYAFEVMTAEAVDNPRVSSTAILQKARKRKGGFKLSGPKELLSKIGQAEPGAALAIVGFLQQRDQFLRLVNVETLGVEK